MAAWLSWFVRKPGNLVTLRDLRRLHACREQRDLFKRTFGRQVLITEQVVRAHGWRFDVSWADYNLLTPEGQVEYRQWEAETDRSACSTMHWRIVRWLKMAELLVKYRKWDK